MKDANGKQLKAGNYLIDGLPVQPIRIVNIIDEIAMITIFEDDEEGIDLPQSEIIDNDWLLCDSKGVKL